MSAPDTTREALEPWPLWCVSVYGYDDALYTAPTAAKARWRAFQDFREARPGIDFHEFLVTSRVWKSTRERLHDDGYDYVRAQYGISPRIGAPAEVTDARSERAGQRGLVLYPGRSTAHVHLQFAGSDRAHSYHPSDVRMVAA